MFRLHSRVLLQACILLCAINFCPAAVAHTSPGTGTQSAGPSAPGSSTQTGNSTGTAGGNGTSGQPTISDACKAALQSLNATLDASRTLRSIARTGTATLISEINDASASPNEKLRAIYVTLQTLGTQNLPDGFKSQSDALDAQKSAVDKACDAASGSDAADQLIGNEKTELTNASAPYNKGLLSVLNYAGAAADLICKQFAAVPGMSQAADCALPATPTAVSSVDDLEKALAKGLRALAAIMEQRPDFAAHWAEISALPAINSLSDSDSTVAKKKVTTSLDTLKTAEEAATAAVPGWLQTISKDVAAANLSAASASATVLQDPLNNSASGLSMQKALATKVSRVDDALRAWPSLSVDLQRVGNSHFDDIAQAMDTLRPNIQTMHSLIAQLSDSLAGDMQNFVTESVRLYYFTDVKRLMTALSSASHEIGGLSEAREKAAQERTKLLQAELDLADAQATVSNDQRQVQIFKEEQRQQSALVQAAQLLESKTGLNLKRAQQQNAGDNADLDAAKEQLKESPNDPVLQKEVAAAQKRSDNSSAKVQQVDSLHKDAQDKATQAADKQEASKSNADGIEAKIADAQKALEAAQAQVQLQRRRTLLSADAESQAFAFARDNTPFFVSEPVGVDTDPVKRVLIFGFPDSSSVLLRGLPADVAKVKQIIATFDVPAPQARLTLWTFQLNATLGQNGNKSDAKELNRALEIVDEELGNTRALVNTTLALLRQEIANVVRKRASEICKDKKDEDKHESCDTPGKAKKARANGFFSSSALAILNATSAELPDPAATNTLGEALLMLSLASEQNKICVRYAFNKDLQGALEGLDLKVRKKNGLQEAKLYDYFELPFNNNGQSNKKDGKADNTTNKSDKNDNNVHANESKSSNILPLTWRALGIIPVLKEDQKGQTGTTSTNDCDENKTDQNSHENTSGQSSHNNNSNSFASLSSSQFEILYAYLQENLRRGSEELDALSRELATYNQRMDALVQQQSKLLERAAINQKKTIEDAHNAETTDLNRTNLLKGDPGTWQVYKSVGAQKSVLFSLRENAITRNKKKAGEILSRYNFDPASVKQIAATNDPELLETLLQINASKVNEGYIRARTAAADEMLKQFMIAVEDDIDRAFIQPMIYRLRTRLMTETGVGVGIIERESLLATNRLVARIDPRATAQLQVGTETDLLGEAQQLAQLYFTVQSGGATALLGALNKQKREPPPEIYGVGTGSTFQVTPVFDPSGQALRFKFDYVSQTRITEPSGGTNPQLPRVERHTVNTEVQLSNLETREISRFEANSKIGIPESYSGGIPVLKDLPYGRARVWFPVIAWFVRHAGHDAAAQQSVIFGQTTMYPTIADLVQLLAADNLPSGAQEGSPPAPAGAAPAVQPQAPAAQPPQMAPQNATPPNVEPPNAAQPNATQPKRAQPKPPKD